jgi:hypothetical protein
MKRYLTITAIVVGVCLICGAAAGQLPTGRSAASGTSAASQRGLEGVVLIDVLVPYRLAAGEQVVNGVVQNRVVRSKALGTLDFYWKIVPDPASTGSISVFKVAGFREFVRDGNWRIDSRGDVAPTVIRNFGHGFLNFAFSGSGIGPTKASPFFFVHTEATQFANVGTYELICSEVACNSQTFKTAAPAGER